MKTPEELKAERDRAGDRRVNAAKRRKLVVGMEVITDWPNWLGEQKQAACISKIEKGLSDCGKLVRLDGLKEEYSRFISASWIVKVVQPKKRSKR